MSNTLHVRHRGAKVQRGTKTVRPRLREAKLLSERVRAKPQEAAQSCDLAVEVLRGINIPPAEKPWASLYHQAIAGCRELRFGYDTLALKGDFIVHIRLFKGSREANNNEFYVGLPSDFQRDVELYQTRLVDGFGAGHLPEALKIHAIQHILKCELCKEWIDIMVWAEDEDVIGAVPWRMIREKARYIIEEEDTDFEESENEPKDENEGRNEGKHKVEDTDEHKDMSKEADADEN